MSMMNETVLIVDDEKVVRKLLISNLSVAGFSCLEAASGAEALEQLKSHEVSVALLDVNMPNMSGIELLNIMMKSYPEIAVLMITAVSNSDTAIDCMRQGAYDYIIKPFNSHEVLLRIEHALEKRKLKLDNRIYQTQLEQKVEEQTAKFRASEVNFRNSLDHSPLGIRIVTTDGRTIYTNHAFLDIFGYANAAEINAVPYDVLYTPETYAIHLERVAKGKRGEDVPSSYDINIVRKDGEIRQLLVNRGEVLWNGERQFQMVYQDVTERVKTEKALRDSYEKLNKTLDSIIQTMALTVEMRDPYTAGHQHRVAKLACAIAEEMNLPAEKIKGMQVIGAIHDIGKICVPSEILSKPGRITEAEFSIIKEHPRTGYDILKGIDFPWPVSMAILQHHERLDGSGYPGKLPGDSIILEARILAVADVVEAMASHRPYRPSLGLEKALDEVSGKKGIFYDAEVVDACLKLFNEKGFSLEQIVG